MLCVMSSPSVTLDNKDRLSAHFSYCSISLLISEEIILTAAVGDYLCSSTEHAAHTSMFYTLEVVTKFCIEVKNSGVTDFLRQGPGPTPAYSNYFGNQNIDCG